MSNDEVESSSSEEVGNSTHEENSSDEEDRGTMLMDIDRIVAIVRNNNVKSVTPMESVESSNNSDEISPINGIVTKKNMKSFKRRVLHTRVIER